MFNFENLTFTRFFAALFVIIYHGICLGQNVSFFSGEFAYPIFIMGNTAVLYFFILSGFIFTINYLQKPLKIKQYVLDRFSRIYPVYILGILIVICLPIFTTLKQYGFNNVTLGILYRNVFAYLHENKMGLMSNITMTQTWFYDHRYSINPPNWSLSVEVFFYAAFPVIFYFYRDYLKRINFNYILIFVIALVVLMDFYSKNYVQFFSTPLGYIQYFILGIIVGLLTIQKSIQEVKKFRNYLIVILSGLILADIFILNGLIYAKSNLFFVGGFVVLILSLILINKNTILNSSKFKLMGDISYAMYILNIPVIFYLENLSDFSDSEFSILFYISILLTIFLAFVVNKFVEMPAKNILRKWLKPSTNA